MNNNKKKATSKNTSFSSSNPISQLSTKTLLEIGKSNNNKDLIWTTSINHELPIFLSENNQIETSTITQKFLKACEVYPNRPAMFYEKNSIWYYYSWIEYKKFSIQFALSCISLGVLPFQSVNIIGYNSPEWFISFIGGIMSCIVPVGVNESFNEDTYNYIAKSTNCGILCIDTIEKFDKFKKHLHEFKNLKSIIVWNAKQKEKENLNNLINQYVPIYTWNEFLSIGSKNSSILEIELKNRMTMQKPGTCSMMVYTSSGNTLNPNACMFSHDNLIFSGEALTNTFNKEMKNHMRIISFLNLSHITAILMDIIIPILKIHEVYFSKPNAYSESLLDTLLYVRPQIFFGTPRIYEKIKNRVKVSLESASYIKKRMVKYLRNEGTKYIDYKLNLNNQVSYPLIYPLVSNTLFNSIKKALGLDECILYISGSASIHKKTLEFYKSLGIVIYNNYGLTESTGCHFINYNCDLVSSGVCLLGTEYKIKDKNKYNIGEILLRGRNRFMGYLNNDDLTIRLIDNEGYLYSGDEGFINENNNLILTGRKKDLIVLIGGEVISPLLIEQSFLSKCKICSHFVLIGDNRKYLIALITLKMDQNGIFSSDILPFLSSLGSQSTNIIDGLKCEKIKSYIEGCINELNKESKSYYEIVRKYLLLSHDFTIQSGEITSSYKIDRNVIMMKYSNEIDQIYINVKF